MIIESGKADVLQVFEEDSKIVYYDTEYYIFWMAGY